MTQLNESSDFRSASKLLDKIDINGKKTLKDCIHEFHTTLTLDCGSFVSLYFSDLRNLLKSIRNKDIEDSNHFYSSSKTKANMIMEECDFTY